MKALTIDILAEQIVKADPLARAELLAAHAVVPVVLARELKNYCYAAWSSDPERIAASVEILTTLAELHPEPEISALANWMASFSSLNHGQFEHAIEQLDLAATQFTQVDQPLNAAQTQIAKVMALGMLSRYDEAEQCGLVAREVFVAHGELCEAGKIDLNLGVLAFHRDRYAEAVQYYESARAIFSQIDAVEYSITVASNLAAVLAWQHQFERSGLLYETALQQAREAELDVLVATIEGNIGRHALLQGHYDRALAFFEQSRRRFAELGLEHEQAVTERELADAYLELNLTTEALAMYRRIAPLFEKLSMQMAQAWALTNQGRALIQLGQHQTADTVLQQAAELFAAEETPVGTAVVALAQSQLALQRKQATLARQSATTAERLFVQAEAWGWPLLARWQRGEAARLQGDDDAHLLLESTLYAAKEQNVLQVAQRCYTSLGLLAAAQGNSQQAETYLQQAVVLLEDQRAALPAEEFRTAFVADKLTPFFALARLCLADPVADRAEQALIWSERGRTRALLDQFGMSSTPLRPKDGFETETYQQLTALQRDLNWSYNQLHRLPDENQSLSQSSRANLQQRAQDIEQSIQELTRQLHQQRALDDRSAVAAAFDAEALARLQRELGTDTLLVEYLELDDELLVFVVSDTQVQVIRPLASTTALNELVTGLRFQIDTLRHGQRRLRTHAAQLTRRAQHYLGQLYDLLLRPLETLLTDRRLVVVAHGVLHYVPFHALYNGQNYVVEQREVCHVPSAALLLRCLEQPRVAWKQALLLGVPDERAPRVRDEVLAIAPLFEQPTTLLEATATVAALTHHAPKADLIHLACHGQFRHDNPLFSSLKLADGWLTARDASQLALHCGLVTLSACETGVSAIEPGEELLGLSRGFLAAGTPTLLVSLWTVDDASADDLMRQFYTRLLAGDGPAAALRAAQRSLLAADLHPFFWSPFVVIGRW
jgi:CHAT domain-containing protein